MSADVVIVGAGIIGAACAYALTEAGLKVLVADRGAPASATTASGEGNILVSDKEPGPELALALASRNHWPALLDDLGTDVEWDPKGGLVVATEPAGAQPLLEFAAGQRRCGVDARVVPLDEVHDLEPLLTPSVTAAVHYPQDAQVQPVLAASALLTAVRRRGGTVRAGIEVSGVDTTADGRIRAVHTPSETIACGAVVNAAGPWSGEFARRLGTPIAVQPRRGLVLVTAALPETVRHKVYDASYVGAVSSDETGLQTSAVVESTPAGPVLIGSSRQHIGFADRIDVTVLRAIARRALTLFPILASVPIQRAYGGFRPCVPDHLPVIGPDPRLPGLWHATGHEGAGIGLAPATARLLTDLLTGRPPELDPRPFRPDRPAVTA